MGLMRNPHWRNRPPVFIFMAPLRKRVTMSGRMTGYILATIALLASTGCGKNSDPLGPGDPDSIITPSLTITYPRYRSGTPPYLEVVRFSWMSTGENPAVDVRYFATMLVDTNGIYDITFDMLGDINENPARYDTLWSDWISYNAPEDSGRTTIIGDNEVLTYGQRHYFFVQGRDDDGNVTEVFERETNARFFTVAISNGPTLTIKELVLGKFIFLGTLFSPEERTLPPGISLSFHWAGNAGQYSSEIAGYRYGWDVTSLESWDAPFDPGTTGSSPIAFFSGVHTLTIEAADLAGYITRGKITIEIVPWNMDRDLLLVDDYYAPPYPVPNLTFPSEYEHDTFWNSICSRAAGFDRERDVYDTYRWSMAPSIEMIGQYRNIIWVYSTHSANKWSQVIEFVPESRLNISGDETPNLISLFLMKGGHVWTSGRSDRGGGLAAVLLTENQIFPIDISREINGPGRTDNSGIYSLPYKDYCVTVIDKIVGQFRSDPQMPLRILTHHDVMLSAFRDDGDPVTAGFSGLPETLALRDKVTAAGSYFCTDSTCSPGGFTYVEVYDPDYWMSSIHGASRHCFHPLYRMRAASPLSALDGQTVAIWVTRFDDIVPDTPGGIAAPSVHFGVPLWFFRHESADSIADAVFGRWGI